ncbi:MAG: peptidoglycan recognition family protein, partial [bacterium]
MPGPVPFARPRSSWARGGALAGGMDPMLKPRYITVHHDGMTPFWGKTETEAKARIELIRNGHRGKGWADIGYHYVVDRNGTVWQGRDLTRWQGAHVKERNEHNIGVVCLG